MSHDLISYRHKYDTANEKRFIQPRSEALPSWADDVQPYNGPWPCQTTMDDVWGWLRAGMMTRIEDEQLRKAHPGTSPYALCMEDNATGELVIADYREGEGFCVRVYRGDTAWDLPLDGSEPRAL